MHINNNLISIVSFLNQKIYHLKIKQIKQTLKHFFMSEATTPSVCLHEDFLKRDDAKVVGSSGVTFESITSFSVSANSDDATPYVVVSSNTNFPLTFSEVSFTSSNLKEALFKVLDEANNVVYEENVDGLDNVIELTSKSILN